MATIALTVAVVGVVAGGIAYAVGSHDSSQSPATMAGVPRSPGGPPITTPLTTSPAPSTVPSSATTTTTTAPASPGLVTPAVEEEVVASTWQPFASALADDDLTTLQRLSTPSAYGAVTGAFECGCPPWPPGYTSAAFSAPPQTSYPLSFWAEFLGKNYDGQSLTKEVVFTQASADSPWLVAYLGAFEGGPPLLIPGSNLSDVSAGNFPVAPLAERLVNYIQEVDTAGAAVANSGDGELSTPSPPQPPAGIGSDQVLTSVADNSFSVTENQSLQGHSVQLTHTVVDVSSPFEFHPSGESSEPGACFTMRTVAVTSRGKGQPIVQPADQSAYTTLLDPGSYSSVTETKTFDLCFVDENGGSYLLTNWGGDVSVVGTP